MGFRRKGGVLIIHHVCWNGEVKIITVPAGKQYIASVPSGGLFAMTVCVCGFNPRRVALIALSTHLHVVQSWGSGADKDSDVSHEVFARDEASSYGLISDRDASHDQQPQMLRRAVEELSRRGKLQGDTPRPLTSLPVEELVDLETEELDKSGGVEISLNHYWWAPPLPLPLAPLLAHQSILAVYCLPPGCLAAWGSSRTSWAARRPR